MTQAGNLGFQFSTPAMDVERAVAELRFGRPVVLKDGNRKLAVLALDCVAPLVYNQFAAATDNGHSIFLTAHRAGRLGLKATGDIVVPLRGVTFAAASELSYALDASAPAVFTPADGLMRASAELARLALLLPAMVCAEIDDGDTRFAACPVLLKSSLTESDNARQTFEIVARTRVPLRELGDADFVVFRGGLAQKDQIAIVVGKPDLTRPVPIRIHSSCLTGDLCGSLKCDCGDQLRNGLALLKQAGGGVLLYLDQEGRGTGIGAKMRAYGYQSLGLDTIDADAELGLGSDHRRYEAAVAMLRLLDIANVVVYTNNPAKIAGLRAGGIEVASRVGVTGLVTAENAGYLRTKARRAGHMLDLNPVVAAN
ncbi:MAG: GTP cyclohydrolase II RibA [Allorhizobium sp.]